MIRVITVMPKVIDFSAQLIPEASDLSNYLASFISLKNNSLTRSLPSKTPKAKRRKTSNIQKERKILYRLDDLETTRFSQRMSEGAGAFDIFSDCPFIVK